MTNTDYTTNSSNCNSSATLVNRAKRLLDEYSEEAKRYFAIEREAIEQLEKAYRGLVPRAGAKYTSRIFGHFRAAREEIEAAFEFEDVLQNDGLEAAVSLLEEVLEALRAVNDSEAAAWGRLISKAYAYTAIDERRARAAFGAAFVLVVAQSVHGYSRARAYRSPSRRSSSSTSSPGSGGGGDDGGGSDQPEPPAATLCFKKYPFHNINFSQTANHTIVASSDRGWC